MERRREEGKWKKEKGGKKLPPNPRVGDGEGRRSSKKLLA
jgi:hypothetical protein